jgi:glycosyltransferase involved in cell wall biosynthesis
MNPGRLISVIVTCYNQGKYLRQALESLVNQSHTEWECLVVNDGSTDDTERIALEYSKNDGRFCYFHQPNGGVSSARNFGLTKAKGQFIQFLDADDHLHPDKMTTQLDILESNEEIEVVYGSSRYFIDGEPDVLYPLHYNGSVPCDLTFRDKFQVEMLMKHNVATNCAALYRSSIVKKIKFRKQIFEDWIFNLECALNGAVFHFDNSFSAYSYIRMTDNSQMIHHTNQLAEIRNLQASLLGLVSEYNYNYSKKIFVPEAPDQLGNFIYFLRQICPPILFSVASKLKTKYLSWKRT